MKDFIEFAIVWLTPGKGELPKCSCKLFLNKGVVCHHLISYMTFNAILELPPQFIPRRWKIRDRTSHGIAFEFIMLSSMNQVNVGALCQKIMNLGRDGVVEVISITYYS